MYKIAYHPLYVHPLPEGHRFPMLKYELIRTQLLYEGAATENYFFQPEPIEEKYILLTHDKEYWKRLKTLRLTDREIRRIGFPFSRELVERELRIIQGTLSGCKYAISDGISFNIAGGTHHAGSNWGEGFCLLNDQAIAANVLLREKLCSKILMIDLDVHQGNGSAQIFKNESRVFTFSMHAERNFPFEKEESDLDIALGDGVEGNEYLKTLKGNLAELLEKVQPDFVFYLAGVDVLATDKLGRLKLSKEACKQRDRLVFQHCNVLGIPLQVSMGGGYSSHLRDVVDAHCNTFKQANDIY